MNTNEKTQRDGSVREFVLPVHSRNFIENIKDKDLFKINLYLAQNRLNYSYDKIRPLILSHLEIECIDSKEIYDKKMAAILKKLQNRNRELLENFSEAHTYGVAFHNRLILGEGSVTPCSSVVLLKFHPLYGVPYIAASTIKGNLRSCWRELYSGPSGKETAKEEMELFGSAEPEDSCGDGLIFFDSYPDQFTLTLDVANPHYKDYYSGKSNPTDDQKLTPIMIICLEKSHFEIPLACNNEKLWNREKTRIMDAFKLMIETYGIGAKTALGYGMGMVDKMD